MLSMPPNLQAGNPGDKQRWSTVFRHLLRLGISFLLRFRRTCEDGACARFLHHKLLSIGPSHSKHSRRSPWGSQAELHSLWPLWLHLCILSPRCAHLFCSGFERACHGRRTMNTPPKRTNPATCSPLDSLHCCSSAIRRCRLRMALRRRKPPSALSGFVTDFQCHKMTSRSTNLTRAPTDSGSGKYLRCSPFAAADLLHADCHHQLPPERLRGCGCSVRLHKMQSSMTSHPSHPI